MKQYFPIIIIAAVIIVLFIGGGLFLFVLEEGYQAVVVRFGKIEAVELAAGLKFKLPWDEVHRFPKKILSWDGAPQDIPTEQPETLFIFVDTTARWFISDLKKFYEANNGGNQSMALSRLDDIIDSNVRTVISRNFLTETVRDTKTPLNFSPDDILVPNDLILKLQKPADGVSRYIRSKLPAGILKAVDTFLASTVPSDTLINGLVNVLNGLLTDGTFYDEERFTGVSLITNVRTLLAQEELSDDDLRTLNRILLETVYPKELAVSPVKKGRKELSSEMLTLTQNVMYETENGEIKKDEDGKIQTRFGIEIKDIVIRQIRYRDDLTESVYQRMIKERNQEAEKIRSFGVGEKSRILGETKKEVEYLVSDAQRQKEEIMGRADAEATEIYAKAYNKDREFFRFWRTLESYKNTMPKMSKTLSTDPDYFDYLYDQRGR